MEILIPIVTLIISVVLHEIMHGYTGDRLGDPTPRLMGRLTLNPIKHLDPLMSVAFPALLILIGSPIIFGAAKPVPINPINFKDPQKDMAIVALAGPLTNFALAIISAVLFHGIIAAAPNPLLLQFFASMVTINLVLAFLNLIPIPPLDGSKILMAFMPPHLARQFESIAPYGIFILLALFFFPIGPFSLGGVLRELVNSSLTLLGLS